jgi:hypothetical protein
VTSNAARSSFFAEQSGKRAKMLFGQDFCRSHQGSLVPGTSGPDHRRQRHHGLALADLTHQESSHRGARAEVLADLGDDSGLIIGRLERQGAEPLGVKAVAWRNHDRAR